MILPLDNVTSRRPVERAEALVDRLFETVSTAVAGGKIMQEGPIALTSVADLLRRPDGRKPSYVSLWRWVTQGCRAAGGGRVRLEAVKIGASWYTSAAAIERWSAARSGLSTAALRSIGRLPSRTDRQRRRDNERAKAELRAAGMME